MEQLQEFDIQIEYIPGELNNLADFLSRNNDYLPMCSVCRTAKATSQTDTLAQNRRIRKSNDTQAPRSYSQQPRTHSEGGETHIFKENTQETHNLEGNSQDTQTKPNQKSKILDLRM